MIILISACGPSSSEEKDEISTVQEDAEGGKTMNLITVDELINKTGINPNDYLGIDLQEFINEYEITEDIVEDLNVPVLLESYNDDKKANEYNYRYMFDNIGNRRTDDYYSEISRIGAYYNISTSVESVLIDFSNDKKYISKNNYIFDDIRNSTECEYTTDDKDALLTLFKDHDFFNWTSAQADTKGTTAGQAFVVVVEYDDGTEFRVDYTGIVDQVAPNGYEALLDKLFE